MHAFLNEGLGLSEEFTSNEDDRGGTITDLVILRLGDVDEGLGSGVNDVKKRDKGSSIVGDSH